MAIPQHVSMQIQLSPPLPIPFGRCMHMISRTPARISSPSKRERLKASGSGNFPSFQYYTVTSLTPSCDWGQFTLLRYLIHTALLPSLRLPIACSALPMLHPRIQLLPCDDDEDDVGLCARANTPTPAFCAHSSNT